MKKILVSLFMLMAFSVSFAGAPAATDEVMEFKIDTSTTWLDTLVDGTDSSTLFLRWYPDEREYGYYLINKSFTGYSTDSVKIKIYAYCYNSSGTLLNKQVVDSIVTADSKPIKIPLGLGMAGATYTIKALTYTGAGGQTITNGWQIVKYRPLNYNK
jgi:hypothetical protein